MTFSPSIFLAFIISTSPRLKTKTEEREIRAKTIKTEIEPIKGSNFASLNVSVIYWEQNKKEIMRFILLNIRITKIRSKPAMV